MKIIKHLFLSLFIGSWLMAIAPVSTAAIPTMPDVELGDIVDEGDGLDTKFVKIFGWVLQGVGAIIIVGVLITFAKVVWQGLEKVRDDKKHKDFELGDLITQAIVGIIVLIVTIPIGIMLYKYGSSMTG